MSIVQTRTSALRFWLAIVSVLVAFAILISLGTWQVHRLQWKEALLASIHQRMTIPPAPLAQVETQFIQTGDVDYLPVTMTGVFEHAREQFFFATFNGASGFYVYTPLRLADGRAIFVNRGFVPFDRKDPAGRAQGQVEGEVAISGLARNPLAEKPSGVYDNDPAKNIFFWKDRDAMAANAGLQGSLIPFFVDAGDAPNPGDLPIGGVTLVSLSNNHLQYAVTWYGLALALAGVTAVWLFKRRRP